MAELPVFHRLPQLQDPELLFFRILDEVPDMAIWLDQDGHIVYVNAQAFRRLGYSRDELLGSPVSLIAPGYPWEDLAELLEDIRVRKAVQFELDHQTKAGVSFPAEVKATYLDLGDCELLCGLVVDLTERKRAEAETIRLYTIQKRREQRLYELVRTAQGGGVPVADLQALLADEF